MPRIPRVYGKRRRVRKPRARYAGQLQSRFPSGARTGNSLKFCETFAMGPLTCSGGGSGTNFTVAFNQIPQFTNYSNLFNQFAIRKLQVILIPRYNSNDISTAGVAGNFYLPQICYSIQDTPAVVPPTSQQQVLTDNGAKIVTLDRKRIMTCVPKPYLSMRGNRDGQTDQNVAVRTKKLIWLNTSGPDVTSNGVSIPHGTIQLWTSNNGASSDVTVADIYYKVWFVMRDPA